MKECTVHAHRRTRNRSVDDVFHRSRQRGLFNGFFVLDIYVLQNPAPVARAEFAAEIRFGIADIAVFCHRYDIVIIGIYLFDNEITLRIRRIGEGFSVHGNRDGGALHGLFRDAV